MHRPIGIIANSGQRVRIEEIRQTALDCGMYDWKEPEMVQLAEHMDSLYGQWKNAQAVLNSSKEN